MLLNSLRDWVKGSDAGGREESLEQIHPELLRDILATRPFLPDQAMACYISDPQARQFEQAVYRVLIVEQDWLHLLQVIYNPPGGTERGQPVERWSIRTRDVVAMTGRWSAYDSLQDSDEALEVSNFHVSVNLERELGPLGKDFELRILTIRAEKRPIELRRSSLKY